MVKVKVKWVGIWDLMVFFWLFGCPSSRLIVASPLEVERGTDTEPVAEHNDCRTWVPVPPPTKNTVHKIHHEGSRPPMKNPETYDYVIVGGGPSAMGLLCGLLEEASAMRGGSNPFPTIALIESGNRSPDPSTMQLKNWYLMANRKGSKASLSGRSLSHVDTEITGRAMDLPLGRGLGGTTNINAGLVATPLQQDFDAWSEPWKNSMLPSSRQIFHKLQSHGSIRIRSVAPWILENEEFSGADWDSEICTLEKTTTTVSGYELCLRRNYYNGFLLPYLEKNPDLQDKITWLLQTQVQRLLIQNRRVYGVECQPKGAKNDSSYFEVRARSAVILCTGAVESPALLMVSGLGSNQHPYQGVGRHLRDQVLLPRAYLTSWQRMGKPSYPTNGIAALGFWKGPKSGDRVNYQVAVADPYSHDSVVPAVLAFPLRQTSPSRLWRWINESIFQVTRRLLGVAIRWTPLGTILNRCSTTLMMFLLNPFSEGSVTIVADPAASNVPLRRANVDLDVDVGYLRDARDIEALREAWKVSKGNVVTQSNPNSHSFFLEIFSDCIFEPLSKLLGITDWFPLFCKAFCQPYYHFSGTCAMQIDKGESDWVVDASLRVRDTKGLYICDASVFPNPISSPPALTCCALGYKFSQLLLANSRKDRD